MSVLALVEPGEELSLQALTLARDLGSPVHALSVGDPGTELGAYGVETLHLVEDDRLTAYAPAAWAACLEQLVDQLTPTAVVAAGTNRGNEVLGHLAARRDLPFAANCIATGSDGSVTRVRWGGSLLEEARINSDLKLLTVAPHMVEASTLNGASATVERMEAQVEDADLVVRVIGRGVRKGKHNYRIVLRSKHLRRGDYTVRLAVSSNNGKTQVEERKSRRR